jgi:hypothetical protein
VPKRFKDSLAVFGRERIDELAQFGEQLDATMNVPAIRHDHFLLGLFWGRRFDGKKTGSY